jgi:hypothetical protein
MKHILKKRYFIWGEMNTDLMCLQKILKQLDCKN